MAPNRTALSLNRRALLGAAASAGVASHLGQRPPVAAHGGQHALSLLRAQGLPAGTALVTSLRLPLSGIGANQIAGLLSGAITNWRDVGCPLPVPVTVIALGGLAVDGLAPALTATDYPDVINKLADHPGGVAVVPLDQIDLRVAVPSIDGDSPLLNAGTDAAPVTRIGFGGDILFGRNVGDRMRRYNDYTFPMLQLKDLFDTFDLTICNWECFVSTTITPPEVENPGGQILDFVTDPAAIRGVIMAGVDAVSLANNHAFYSDAGYGAPAYFATAGFLDAAGLPHFGAGANLAEARRPFVTEVNGLSVAVIGIDGVTANVDHQGPWSLNPEDRTIATDTAPGTNPLVDANIRDDITALAAEHDIVIPFFHMGEQYLWKPRDFAIDVTRMCIDAGASAVVTSHPHTIMGMEIYKGRPIFHAIGNLVYDQMFSVDTRTGYILEMTFKGKDVVGFRLHGFENFDFSQGRLMPPGENAALLNRFWRSTDMITAYHPQ